MQEISLSVRRELNNYLDELKKTTDDDRRLAIRARADGAIHMAMVCNLLDKQEEADWQNKFVAAMFMAGTSRRR